MEMNIDGEVIEPVKCFTCGERIEYKDGDIFVVRFDSENAMFVVTCMKCHLDHVFDVVYKAYEEDEVEGEEED